jgi:hypothetical protein
MLETLIFISASPRGFKVIPNEYDSQRAYPDNKVRRFGNAGMVHSAKVRRFYACVDPDGLPEGSSSMREKPDEKLSSDIGQLSFPESTESSSAHTNRLTFVDITPPF